MKLFILLALLCLPLTGNTNDNTTNQNSGSEIPQLIPQGWALNFNLGSASINPELASQGLDSSAFVFGMSMDNLTDNWYSSILLEIVEYDDNYGFKQDVVGSGYSNSGSTSTAKSSASSTSLGGAFGHAWFVNNNKAMLYAQGGFNLIMDATRGIENCSDCHEETLNIDGGLFTRIGANLYLDGVIVGVYSMLALSGDIESGFGITAGFKY